MIRAIPIGKRVRYTDDMVLPDNLYGCRLLLDYEVLSRSYAFSRG